MDTYEEMVIGLEEKIKIFQNNLKNLESVSIILKEDVAKFEKSRDIVNAVLSITQDQIKGYIEDVVTLALTTVFGEDYNFSIRYDLKRGKSEANLILTKDGMELSPRGDETGGGPMDVIGLGLRFALWSLREPRGSSTFILDEPGTAISEDLRPKFGIMLSKLSSMLGVQIIMMSHDSALIDSADKIIRVEQPDNKTSIIVESGE